MKRRILCFLLSLVLLIGLTTATAMAGEVPYQSYTTDRWGNAVPAPNSYIPVRSVGGDQLGCGSFSNPQDLFYAKDQGRIYLADAGNGRVVILAEDLSYLGEIAAVHSGAGEEPLVSPQGVFVSDDGVLYIADKGAGRVLTCTEDGELLSVLPTPASPLLPESFVYQPTKVVVDEKGRIYILSQGIYQGILYLDRDGTFIRFFGPNEVEMTILRQVLQIWKKLLPDKAAASMQSFNPIEYSNLFLSEDGYIYTTAAGSENGSKVIAKLNPVGINVDPFSYSGNWTFSDITVDEYGIRSCLDTTSGKITQLSEKAGEMFTFGGIGDQVGLFRRAVSLIDVDGDLFVLDADKNTITEFTLTDYGRLVHEATALFNSGLYRESLEPWSEVVRRNANYLPAYVGLGDAYYQLNDFETAMYYYKLGGSRSSYSTAFREASLETARAHFSTVAMAVLAAAAGIGILRHVLRKRKRGKADATASADG